MYRGNSVRRVLIDFFLIIFLLSKLFVVSVSLLESFIGFCNVSVVYSYLIAKNKKLIGKLWTQKWSVLTTWHQGHLVGCDVKEPPCWVFFLSSRFILLFIYVFVCYVHMYGGPWRLEEAIRSRGAGVTGNYELFGMAAGNQTAVLCMGSKSLTTEPSLHPQVRSFSLGCLFLRKDSWSPEHEGLH